MYHVYSIQYLNPDTNCWEELESNVTTDLSLSFFYARKLYAKGRYQSLISIFLIKSTEDFNEALTTLFEYDNPKTFSSSEKERRASYVKGEIPTVAKSSVKEENNALFLLEKVTDDVEKFVKEAKASAKSYEVTHEDLLNDIL